jgi:hypothetical protein
MMRLFDALILNVHRRQSDQLIEPGSWKLRLIDHSRAFGASTTLPEGFISRCASFPPSLLKNLGSLEEASLKILLDELLGDAQVVAMLRRRDAILKKIAMDRERCSNSTVSQVSFPKTRSAL